MAVDPTGRYVYVTNAGPETVQTFVINQSTGDLTSVESDSTGTNPWAVAVDPTGRFVYVAHYSDSFVQAFSSNNFSAGSGSFAGSLGIGTTSPPPCLTWPLVPQV